MTAENTLTTDRQDPERHNSLNFDGAADAFTSNLLSADKRQKSGLDQETNEKIDPQGLFDQGDPEVNTDVEDEEDQGRDDDGAPIQDDLDVEIFVGDERHTVSVKELKRLYGQETSLTEKSLELAGMAKRVEEDGARHAVALDRMLQTAKARWQPYAQMDMLDASRTLDPEAFKQLRKDASEAHENFMFLSQEIDAFLANTQQQHAATLQAQAKEATRVLSDPEKGIPGWSPQLHKDIRDFAVGSGMDVGLVDSIVDPKIIKILHNAMLYERGKKAVESKIAKKIMAPKKVLKTTLYRSNQGDANTKQSQAKAQLKKTGRMDDAANAFMSNWIES